MTLQELGIKYGTQKVTQGFLPIYERYMDEDKSTYLLEVGVASGASLLMWKDYFTFGRIYGIEKHPQNLNDFNGKNINLIFGDATDPTVTGSIDKTFDYIIDDGSHIAGEQLKTFDNLWPKLKEGGYYFIEDLFTLYDQVWNHSGDNIINLIQRELKTILICGNEVQEVHFHGGNSMGGLLVLRKRFETYRINDEYK